MKQVMELPKVTLDDSNNEHVRERRPFGLPGFPRQNTLSKSPNHKALARLAILCDQRRKLASKQDPRLPEAVPSRLKLVVGQEPFKPAGAMKCLESKQNFLQLEYPEASEIFHQSKKMGEQEAQHQTWLLCMNLPQ